ncbi:MAG: VIT domain-containing protein [Bacteroidales bacterium]|jgi:Ca-activated chloride channel family protein|nr:VIT domain-containing protein [Bacteroidales bacterium]
MKTRKLYQTGLRALSGIIISLPLLAYTVMAQEGPSDGNSQSPYFFIPDGNPALDKIPLLSTSAEVNIAGVIADVKINQVYKNEGEKPIEAIYVFPASTRAAVYSMQMTIGERTIIAKIEERKAAREAYEAARENGQSASLLEQERPNVFTMNVANIMPGDEILVEMKYTELLIPEEGVYEFVYPAVVGPRYQRAYDDIASSMDNWVSNPYTREGESPLYTFDISVSISAGMPIQEISCNTHNMDIHYDDPALASLTLKEGEWAQGNRDVVVRYRLAGGQIESGLLLYEGKEENFFLAMVQPPERPEAKQIPPREYVFIVDISGSMHGYPLDVSKKLMRNLLSDLNSRDMFNILLFAGGSSLFSEKSISATEENIRNGIDFIDRQHGGGGTELLPALKRALALEPAQMSLKFKATRAYARSFVIITDGYVTVEKEAFDLIRNKLGEASFFPFGIGSGVNRFLIEGMAHAGMGTPFVVTEGAEANATAERFRKYISQPVLTNIKIDYDGFDAYDVEPLSMADVFAERPLIIFGKYKGKAKGSIRISGTSGQEEYSKQLALHNFEAAEKNAALTYLWAREKIRILDDYASLDYYTGEHEQAITDLGLKYNLLTQYTSFVAIDNLVRNENGTYTTVSQPLPLPQGVSNCAVGGVGSYSMQKSSRGLVRSGGSTKYTAVEICEDATEISPAAETEPVFTLVEKMAEFSGDPDGIEAFIRKNQVHPPAAFGMDGTVWVEFIIEADGSLSEVKILIATDPVFEHEAQRLIWLTDKRWKAALQGGKKVRSKMILEVSFDKLR